MGQNQDHSIVNYDRARTARAPDSLRDFAERSILQLQSYGNSERRSFPRHYTCFSVIVIPLASGKEIGPPYEAMSRDFSQNGIAFYQNRVIREQSAVVELTCPEGTRRQMSITIVRCRPAGMFFEVAGYFEEVLPDDFCRRLTNEWEEADPQE